MASDIEYTGQSREVKRDAYDSDNPFDDDAVAQHWAAVYSESEYECRHVFDPKLTWTAEEEKQLIRKLDWRVCLWAVSVPHPKDARRG
jgi:hypothetical protein